MKLHSQLDTNERARVKRYLHGLDVEANVVMDALDPGRTMLTGDSQTQRGLVIRELMKIAGAVQMARQYVNQ